MDRLHGDIISEICLYLLADDLVTLYKLGSKRLNTLLINNLHNFEIRHWLGPNFLIWPRAILLFPKLHTLCLQNDSLVSKWPIFGSFVSDLPSSLRKLAIRCHNAFRALQGSNGQYHDLRSLFPQLEVLDLECPLLDSDIWSLKLPTSLKYLRLAMEGNVSENDFKDVFQVPDHLESLILHPILSLSCMEWLKLPDTLTELVISIFHGAWPQLPLSLRKIILMDIPESFAAYYNTQALFEQLPDGLEIFEFSPPESYDCALLAKLPRSLKHYSVIFGIIADRTHIFSERHLPLLPPKLKFLRHGHTVDLPPKALSSLPKSLEAFASYEIPSASHLEDLNWQELHLKSIEIPSHGFDESTLQLIPPHITHLHFGKILNESLFTGLPRVLTSLRLTATTLNRSQVESLPSTLTSLYSVFFADDSAAASLPPSLTVLTLLVHQTTSNKLVPSRFSVLPQTLKDFCLKSEELPVSRLLELFPIEDPNESFPNIEILRVEWRASRKNQQSTFDHHWLARFPKVRVFHFHVDEVLGRRHLAHLPSSIRDLTFGRFKENQLTEDDLILLPHNLYTLHFFGTLPLNEISINKVPATLQSISSSTFDWEREEWKEPTTAGSSD